MDMKQNLGLKGKVTFRLFDKHGKLKQEDVIENGITTLGYDLLCQLLAGTGGDKLSHIGIGDDDTAFDPGQTDLIGTSYRKSATYAHTGSTLVFTLTAAWGANEPIAGTFSVKEGGTFNAAAAGTMASRLVRAVLNKLADDILEVEYEWTLSNP